MSKAYGQVTKGAAMMEVTAAYEQGLWTGDKGGGHDGSHGSI